MIKRILVFLIYLMVVKASCCAGNLEKRNSTIPYPNPIYSGINFRIAIDLNDQNKCAVSEGLRINRIKAGTDYNKYYKHNPNNTPENNIPIYATDIYNNDARSHFTSVNYAAAAPPNDPPQVTITYPDSGEFINIWTPTNITASASDSDGEVISVAFYINGIKKSTDPVSPYFYLWTPIATGIVEVYTVVTDNDMDSTISDTIIIQVKNPMPPVISIQQPATGDEFTENNEVLIITNASDNDGIVEFVDLYINNIKTAIDSVQPFSFSWISTSGSIAIKVIATDNEGLSSVPSSILISVPENEPPIINITSPADSANYTYGDEIIIQASATDDGTVDSVEFYINNLKEATDHADPFEYRWTGVSGSYTIYAIAYDNSNHFTKSDTIKITIHPAVNQNPIISIIQPQNNSVFDIGANVTIEVSASDPDGAISNIEFKLNSNSLITFTNSPYSIQWTTVEGNYTISAIATDNSGAKTSQSVEIEVGNESGLNDLSINRTMIKVSPNPVENDCYISFPSDNEISSFSYTIYDILGNIVAYNNLSLIPKDNTILINMSELKSGIYIAVLSFIHGETKLFRIIKK